MLIGSMVLQLQGHAGDGLITAASINPCFHYVGTTVGITLDEIVLKIGTDCAAGTQHVFDIDPMALFGLAGPDDLLSLRCRS